MSEKDERFAHLDEHGYVVLEGALTADEVDELRIRSIELTRKERTAGAQLYLDDNVSSI